MPYPHITTFYPYMESREILEPSSTQPLAASQLAEKSFNKLHLLSSILQYTPLNWIFYGQGH